MELRELKPAVAVRGPHHRDVDPDVVERVDAVHPTSLDRRHALQLHTKFDKERDSSLEVVDDDAHVVHPLNRHGGSPSSSGACPGDWGTWDGASATFSTPGNVLSCRDLHLAVTALGRPHRRTRTLPARTQADPLTTVILTHFCSASGLTS